MKAKDLEKEADKQISEQQKENVIEAIVDKKEMIKKAKTFNKVSSELLKEQEDELKELLKKDITEL